MTENFPSVDQQALDAEHTLTYIVSARLDLFSRARHDGCLYPICELF
jgi:hypothetical protein